MGEIGDKTAFAYDSGARLLLVWYQIPAGASLPAWTLRLPHPGTEVWGWAENGSMARLNTEPQK